MIRAENIGKRFNKEWIFRDISIELNPKDHLAIVGANGSGKSTLIKIFAGLITPTTGKISFYDENQIENPDWYILNCGLSAPYVNLIEELTLEEHLKFHFNFRTPSISLNEIADRSGLIQAMDKKINEFSSGMKSRLKLALCLFSNNKILLLDEPTANMDEQGIIWYLKEMKALMNDRLIIIASNSRYEYDFLSKQLDISKFKIYQKKDNK